MTNALIMPQYLLGYKISLVLQLIGVLMAELYSLITEIFK